MVSLITRVPRATIFGTCCRNALVAGLMVLTVSACGDDQPKSQALAQSECARSSKSESTCAWTYKTPANFSTILSERYTPTTALSAGNTLSHLGRYLIANSSSVGTSTNFLSVGSGANPTYAVTTSTLGTTTTYNDYFIKTFQAVADSDGSCFRLDSELHSNYSLDVDLSDSNTLKLRNNWGAAKQAYGYLCFSYDSSTGILKVNKRYNYSIADYSHSLDTSFPGSSSYYVQVKSNELKLVTGISEASPLYLFGFPIDVAIPSAFNPDGTAAVTNARMTISGLVTDILSSMLGLTGKILKDLKTAFFGQVVVNGGNSAETSANVDIQLAAIQASVEDQGGRLRYGVEVYKAFRNGLLSNVSAADGIANGVLGMNTVPYVYFTNEIGPDNLTRHPFMVIATYSIADRPSRLLDIARPPGEGGSDYVKARVTRSSVAAVFHMKIPMRDYGQVSTLTENTMLKTLNSEAGNKVANDVYNYASISNVGIAADGMEIYPTYNNNLIPSQAAAELTSNGNHVGQGMGIHYHADSFSALPNGLALYNLRDYVGQAHPPLIGFGFDGIALFGRYVSDYPGLRGHSVALDAFGAHDHDGIGYHYHAHTEAATSLNGASYALAVLMKGAWAGRINDIPEFWDTSRGSPLVAAQRNRYVGNQ